jgi:hypothetical protein
MLWLKLKIVLQLVNPSNAQKVLLSFVEMAFGADGLKKCAMLQIVPLLYA